MSSVLFLLGLMGIVIGIMVVCIHFMLTLIRGRRDLFFTAFSIPIAWLCLSCAAWRAFFELLFRPFYWAKTSHGHVALSSIHQTFRLYVTRIALACIVALATYASFAYVTRLSVIIQTWGAPQYNEAQVLTALQKIGITHEHKCEAIEKAKYSLQKWDITAPENGTWVGVDGVSVLVSIPQTEVENRQLLWKVRLDDGYWFTYLDAIPVIPGRFIRLELDLRPFSTKLIAQDHERAWDDYASHEIEEVRLVDYSQKDKPEEQLVKTQLHQCLAFSIAKENEDAIDIEISQSPKRETQTLSLLEWSFGISKQYKNPYDADEVQIDARFVHQETGKELKHPAFFMIPYQRNHVDGREVLTPNGTATWCLRWAPPEPGHWRGEIEIRESNTVVARCALQDMHVSAGSHPGYIQRHPSKPYLQHANGSFFYPIGHNVCWPIDTKKAYNYDFELPVDSGTYAYDHYFKRMADGKENWARIWMAYTWLGLEGISDWRHFDGLGHYNQAHASRLDHLMDEARENNIYIRLTMQHYSDFSRKWGNSNWNTNPYSRQWGGPLRHSGEFLTNKLAREYQKKRLRYIIARWGWDPHIESWELWGEVNLLDNFTQENAKAWHREMIDHIHDLDNSNRPIFSHCHNWQLGMRLWPTKGLDCVQGNGYIRPPNHTPNHVINFTNYINEVKHFAKPIFMAEYGGRSELGAPSRDYLEAQLHSGLWAGVVHPFAGAPFSWWWNFIDGEDLYFHFAAVHTFVQDIDRIKRDLKTVKPLVHLADGALHAHGMQDNDGGLYWIYHPRVFLSIDVPKVEHAQVQLQGLENGTYRLRVLNTWTGKWTVDKEIVVSNGGVQIPLPVVEKDLAIRLDRKQAD